MLPGIPQLVAAALGGLALAVGLVVVLNGLWLAGAAILVGGVALLGWSVQKPR